MKAYENTIQKYQALNKLAKVGGTVVLGGSGDIDIPVGELKQSFELEATIYNRSVEGLTTADAANVYDACVASLRPSTLILRLGEADVELFERNADEFVRQYRELIAHVRAHNGKCEIAVASLGNSDASQTVAAMNASLRKLAEATRCSFEDAEVGMKEAVSFVYSIGFVSRLPERKSVHNLARILFGYSAEPSVARKDKNVGKTSKRLNLTAVSLF